MSEKRAFADFQMKIKMKMESSSKSDRIFWDLAKEIGGLSRSRNTAAPDPEVLADHFACKMSHGRDDFDTGAWHPRDERRVSLSNFVVRSDVVLKTLKSLNLSKSVNGAHRRQPTRNSKYNRTRIQDSFGKRISQHRVS